MTTKELAEKIIAAYPRIDHPKFPEELWKHSAFIESLLSSALEDTDKEGFKRGYKEAEKDIAAKQALIYGEGAMLGGRVVTNEEFYKQPTDYIKEANKEAYEEGLKAGREKELLTHCYCAGGSATWRYICDGCMGSRINLNDLDDIKREAYLDAAQIAESFERGVFWNSSDIAAKLRQKAEGLK